jgi:RimJ/RimL family protein N-acetyltransferase
VFRLETERLILREMRAEDATELLTVFGDPKVMAAFAAQPFDAERMRAWVDRNLRHQAEHGYGLFSIVRRGDGAVIGDCGLEHMDLGVELGYDLRSDHWGRGLATEAASAVRDLAFGRLGIDRLISLIRVGNGASERVARKIGMAFAEQIDRGGTAYRLFAMDRT